MRGFVRFAREQNLSMSQLGALFRLQRQGACTVGDISDELGVTAAAVSQMLERLVRSGMVLRSEDPRDRRAKRIELTELGRSTVKLMMEARQRWFEALGESLEPDERRDSTTVLRLLTARARRLEERCS